MEIPAPDFDLEKTLDSGQVFHWEKVGKGFVERSAICRFVSSSVARFCAQVASGSADR